jgi:hypothetical protein
MHPLHIRYLDGFLYDLNLIHPPLQAEAKSRFLCLEAMTFNTFIPRPSSGEMNTYLMDHGLPPLCVC